MYLLSAPNRVGDPVYQGGVHRRKGEPDRPVLREVEERQEQQPHPEDVYPAGAGARQDVAPAAYLRVAKAGEPPAGVFLVLVIHAGGQEQRAHQDQRGVAGGEEEGQRTQRHRRSG